MDEDISWSENHPGWQVENSITFEKEDVYFIVRQKIYGTFEISFMLRTTSDSGIILFAGNSEGKDFLCLELNRGQVRYLFDVGSGPRVIEALPLSSLNNNSWHSIKIFRSNLTTHWLTVDDVIKIHDNLPAVKSVYYDLVDNLLFIGSAPNYVTHKHIKSGSKGFQGCLGDLKVNGMNLNKLEKMEKLVFMEKFREHLIGGCLEPRNECLNTSNKICWNGGECVSLWSKHSCDCTMTGHQGDSCNDVGTSVTFSTNSFLQFLLPLPSHTKHDRIVLAFKTSNIINKSTLIFVSSLTSQDFIELSITPSNVEAVYNVGTNSHSLSISHVNIISTQSFNILRFHRDQQNASLQLNQSPPMFYHPSGNQLTTFNHQENILIAAKKLYTNDTMCNFFQGTITGITINGIKILDVLNLNKSSVGDVVIKRKSSMDSSSVTIKTYFSFTNDEKGFECAEDLCQIKYETPPHEINYFGDRSQTPSRCLYDDANCPSTSLGNVTNRQLTNHKSMVKSHTTSPEDWSKYLLATNPSKYTIILASKQNNYIGKNGFVNDFSRSSMEKRLNLNSPQPNETLRTLAGNTSDKVFLKDNRTKTTLNVILAAGISLLFILVMTSSSWLFYRYKKKGEGSYKLEATDHNYGYSTHSIHDINSQQTKTITNPKKVKLKKTSSKEWYV